MCAFVGHSRRYCVGQLCFCHDRFTPPSRSPRQVFPRTSARRLGPRFAGCLTRTLLRRRFQCEEFAINPSSGSVRRGIDILDGPGGTPTDGVRRRVQARLGFFLGSEFPCEQQKMALGIGLRQTGDDGNSVFVAAWQNREKGTPQMRPRVSPPRSRSMVRGWAWTRWDRQRHHPRGDAGQRQLFYFKAIERVGNGRDLIRRKTR